MKPRLACIDDDQSNLEALRIILSSEFDIDLYIDATQFLSNVGSKSYDVILTDIHMPNQNGYCLYESLLADPRYNGCPIIFISSDDSDSARIHSFELGAVDYIHRSTLPEEMIARIKSKMKFFEQHRNIIEFGTLKVNLTLLKTYLLGNEVPLTFIELKMLHLMLRQYPEVLDKEVLIESIWGANTVMDATIYTHISNLNNKLKDWNYAIQSKSGGIQLVKKVMA